MMSKQAQKSESKAVKVALSHIKAWSNRNYEEARRHLSKDVHVIVNTTQPVMSATDTVGIDKYMDGLVKFGEIIAPGSAEIMSSIGDEQNALIMVSVQATVGPGGAKLPLVGGRLYLLDDAGKIKEERVIFSIMTPPVS